MPELSLPQLEAYMRTMVNLVQGLRAPLDREGRRRAKRQLINEALVVTWRGIPGFPREGRATPTPMEAAALQVLGVVLEQDPPRFLRRAYGEG